MTSASNQPTSTRRCAERLRVLRHANGTPVVHIYGAHTPALGMDAASGQGPVIAFNLLRPDGAWVGYREVERMAALRGITLRTGCCCNPGACAAAVGLTDAAVLANHQRGHVCWDAHDIMDGVPTGVVRASFGWMSSADDADALVALIQQDFCCRSRNGDTDRHDNNALVPRGALDALPRTTTVTLRQVWVYAVKSCRGQRVTAWPLGPRGLRFDREWAVEDGHGRVLTLKQCPRLACIEAVVDVEKDTLCLRWRGQGVKEGIKGEVTMAIEGDGAAVLAWLTVRSTTQTTCWCGCLHTWCQCCRV